MLPALQERDIASYLRRRGVEAMWVDSAVTFLRYGFSQQGLICEDVQEQNVRTSKGHVKEYTALVLVNEPSTGKRGEVRLRYTFDPKRKAAHKLWLPKPGRDAFGDIEA